MKNIKNVAKGLIVFSFIALLVAGSPASAKNDDKGENGYLNARAGLKAEALVKLESATGVVLGPNGTLRVLGAKVVSVSGNVIKAVVSFGESVLNFVVNVDADTKINGNGDAEVGDLKAGDKISFSGTVTSSTSSAITVDGDHLVSRALLAIPDNKTLWSGEIKAVNESDNSLTLGLKNGRTVKVVVNNSTAITLDGVASSLASLDEGDEVKIGGSLSADGSVITATKISAESEDADDNDDDGDKDEEKDRDEKSDNGRGWFLKFRNWLWR
ncbi:MAG: hypothetical protein UX71_C0001G0022 [Parcubacteria group bacterium GW2011_GWA1_47_10]|nr:MAG: hypothetical protein UX71_C0001G0022 [Parcubacteria group bacterium GW2011_GWA1_47_10]